MKLNYKSVKCQQLTQLEEETHTLFHSSYSFIMAHIALRAFGHYRHKLCSGSLAKRQRILGKV